MRRFVLLLLFTAGSALAAHALYLVARPEKPVEVCTMDWLAGELQLTRAQYEAVWEIHLRRCAEICRLDAERAQCAPDTALRLENACRFATQKLIHEVCAQLTPVQREKYLRLVAPCLPPGGPTGAEKMR